MNKQAESETRLLPCPMCDGPADYRIDHINAAGNAYYAECQTCEVATKYGPSKDDVAATWNARPSAPDTAWVPIRTVEDLPQEAGEYLVTMHTPSTDKHVTTKLFYAAWNAGTDVERREQGLRREHWLPSKSTSQWVIAWAERPEPFIAPYTERPSDVDTKDETPLATETLP